MKNESNKRYGKLLVTSKYKYWGKDIAWECICDCGTVKYIKGSNLRANRTTSCGCARYEHPDFGQKPIAKDTKYFYKSWIAIWQRKAESHGRRFDITPEQLDIIYDKQNGLCFYTGDKLILAPAAKNAFSNTNISIDRVDSSKEYTFDNIVLCTKSVNISKNVLSKESFIYQCYRVAKHHNML